MDLEAESLGVEGRCRCGLGAQSLGEAQVSLRGRIFSNLNSTAPTHGIPEAENRRGWISPTMTIAKAEHHRD